MSSRAQFLSTAPILACAWVALATTVAGSAAWAQRPLRPPGAITADVGAAQITPDGARVVYLADPATDGAFEVFSVPIGGGLSRPLSPRAVVGGSVRHFIVSPDSRRVAFLGDLDSDEVFELYAAGITDRSVVKLSPPLVAGGDVRAFFPRISPDSSRVVFRADAERDGVEELYSSPLAGGRPVKLSPPRLLPDALGEFQIAPGSARVVYLAATSADAHELFSVPIAGVASTKLNLPLAPGESVRAGFVVGEERVVYLVGSRLYSVPLSGGPSVLLADTLIDRCHFLIDPSGRSVHYIAGSVPSVYGTEVRSIPIDGGPSTLLNAPSWDRIVFLALSRDGSWLLYFVDNGDEVSGVYSLPTAGGTAAELDASISLSQIFGARFTSDAQRVIIETQGGPSEHEYYSTPTQGGPAVLLLEGWDSHGIGTPDSSRFVFWTQPIRLRASSASRSTAVPACR